MKRILALFGGVFLLAGGAALAAEGHAHGKHHVDAQMAKLHEMMPKYSESEANIDAALEKGDAATVARETKYLLSTAADLKKAKPHKRRKELKEFRRIADEFEKDVRATAESAGKGDLEGARKSFAEARKKCDACHAKFRD